MLAMKLAKTGKHELGTTVTQKGEETNRMIQPLNLPTWKLYCEAGTDGSCRYKVNE